MYYVGSESIPIPWGFVPVPVPKGKSVSTCTHDTWVRVQTDMGMDNLKFIHRLPVTITTNISNKLSAPILHC